MSLSKAAIFPLLNCRKRAATSREDVAPYRSVGFYLVRDVPQAIGELRLLSGDPPEFGPR